MCFSNGRFVFGRFVFGRFGLFSVWTPFRVLVSETFLFGNGLLFQFRVLVFVVWSCVCWYPTGVLMDMFLTLIITSNSLTSA